ncbi:hypothetical protein GRJ2_002631800 [Grus japonensis]|uniref:RNase H type-1 domain-containing protein n=1 Tax=Grus japonensis TaxID=30415 RepID=A0ABC9XW92_GRUJA
MLYLSTDSWVVANALWGWLQQWKQSNWQRRGKPIWAAELWQDIAARLEKLVVKVCQVDAHIPKIGATKEHQNNQQVDQAGQETFSVPIYVASEQETFFSVPVCVTSEQDSFSVLVYMVSELTASHREMDNQPLPKEKLANPHKHPLSPFYHQA